MKKIINSELLKDEAMHMFEYLETRDLNDGDKQAVCDFVAKSIRERLAFKANIMTQFELNQKHSK
jgi:hypothetical protein